MLQNREAELEDFKLNVNLVAYAGSLGYIPAANESSLAYVVLRHNDGDKVVVTKSSTSHHWIYFSVRNNQDNGTIIDFIQNRSALNLGQLRKELRSWLSLPQPMPTAENFQKVSSAEFDRALIISNLEKSDKVSSSSYLRSRGISDEVLSSDRFVGCVYKDNRGNILFPHHDTRGATGYEIKNHDFTGFAKKGRRAIWLSNEPASNAGLFFVESAIDAFSHYALNPDSNYRYASIGGSLGGQQQPVIQKVCGQYTKVVAGFDNDQKGEEYSEVLSDLIQKNHGYERSMPVQNDWNKELTFTGDISL